jgi:hypothetical protein
MDKQQFDQFTRLVATGLTRRRMLSALLTSAVAAVRLGQSASAGAAKRTGARCTQHRQCTSGLCEVTTGTCVAQCELVNSPCGNGCMCQPVGTGFSGNACLAVPESLDCTGYAPCTWNDRARNPFDQLSCGQRGGDICSVTGLCSGPEEVCLSLCPPAQQW